MKLIFCCFLLTTLTQIGIAISYLRPNKDWINQNDALIIGACHGLQVVALGFWFYLF